MPACTTTVRASRCARSHCCRLGDGFSFSTARQNESQSPNRRQNAQPTSSRDDLPTKPTAATVCFMRAQNAYYHPACRLPHTAFLPTSAASFPFDRSFPPYSSSILPFCSHTSQIPHPGRPAPGGAGRAPPPAASPRRKPPPPRRRRPPAPARDPTPPPSRTRAAAGPPPARSRTASSPWSQGRGGSFGSASGAGAEVSPSHPPGPRPQHACLSRLRSIRRINPKAFVPQGTWLRPSAPTASVGGGHQRDNKLAQRIVTASSPL